MVSLYDQRRNRDRGETWVSASKPSAAGSSIMKASRPIPSDRSRVQLDDAAEVRYWMNRFKVSEHRLMTAVRTAGPLLEDVGIYLLGITPDGTPLVGASR